MVHRHLLLLVGTGLPHPDHPGGHLRLHLLPLVFLVAGLHRAIRDQYPPFPFEPRPLGGMSEHRLPLRVLPHWSELPPGYLEEFLRLVPLQRGDQVHRPEDVLEVVRGVHASIDHHVELLGRHVQVF